MTEPILIGISCRVFGPEFMSEIGTKQTKSGALQEVSF